MGVIVLREGTELGTFAQDELASLVQTGELLPSDMVFLDGNWVSLGQYAKQTARRHGVKPSAPIPRQPDASLDRATAELLDASQPGLVPVGPRRRGVFPELSVYEAITDIVKTGLEELLLPLQSAPDSSYIFKTLMLDEFFAKFVNLANDFADNCCQKLVKVIRTTSRISTVREAPTPELARRIRESCFKNTDLILGAYVGLVKKLQVINNNTRIIREELYRLNQTDESGVKPRPPAAPPNGGSEKEWASEEELARQTARLMQMKCQAYSRILEFLKALDPLCKSILSYCYDKCFAAEVNFELESEQFSRLLTETHNKRSNAMETMNRVMALTKEDLEHATAQFMHSLEQVKYHQALGRMAESRLERKAKMDEKFKKVVLGSLIVGLALILFFLSLFFWKS